MKSTQKINYTTKFQSSKLYFDERYENMYGYLIREKAEGYLNDGADIDRDIITKVLESVDNIESDEYIYFDEDLEFETYRKHLRNLELEE